jgi:hypothetical protein
MDNAIKEAIEEGFIDYQDSDMWNMSTNERDIFTLGWKEGYEWILTELAIDKEISEDTLKKYMERI